MRYRASDLPALLRTPLGRLRLRRAAFYRAWPLLALLAGAHRASLARRTRVVAVVGSHGKTTTARAAAAALGRDPEALRGNHYSFVAVSLLRIRPRERHAVLEIGIERPGEMARYGGLVRPDVTVVTSIGSDHNRSLRSLDVTRAEKAEMVRALPPSGIAVLNGDDPNVRWMRTQTRAAVRTFGFDARNDVRASDLFIDWPHGSRFTLHANGEARPVRLRLLGRPMVYSALAAATVAIAEGLDLGGALAAIEALPPTRGRMQPVELSNGAYVLRDEHKSPLETVDASLDVLAEIPAGRRIVVLGDVEEPPGSQGPIYLRLGGRVASLATRAVIVSSRPRYAAGAKRAGMAAAALVHAKRAVPDAVEAIEADLRPGDVVLTKGRSTQRLERVALALAGRPVRCELNFCDAKLRCDRCPMLERGWGDRRVVI